MVGYVLRLKIEYYFPTLIHTRMRSDFIEAYYILTGINKGDGVRLHPIELGVKIY